MFLCVDLEAKETLILQRDRTMCYVQRYDWGKI